MARTSIFSERVQNLVNNKLLPLLFAERSTAQLCKLLNKRLSELGTNGTIHPNRIHTLLSDDISRGINDATLDLIERAADACWASNGGWRDRSDKRLTELKAEAENRRDLRDMNDLQIARHMGIPPAMVRYLLASGSPIPQQISTPDFPKVLARPATPPVKNPDWSFQDIAISRTLEAFRQRPTSKIGLILPTGAGKTRTALRIVLKKLDQANGTDSLVYWVTHRKTLKTQAHRELQKLLSTAKDQIPKDSATLLAKRIRFIMVSELPSILAPDAAPPFLIVVDEAHHVAAPSYKPIFEAENPVPALFLTATPNRRDSLPIGIDEIAFTITHRELSERGVIFVPEFIDHPVPDFEWLPEQIEDLADFVIDEAAERFTKILILAPQTERVEEFYEAILDALSKEAGHPLDYNDIGYIHGKGNSLHCDNDDFLALFADKPRAILLSAQLLLEGFDDPAIDTVILTRPSSSVVHLMQAAGRCVRHSPGKAGAYVVQARNDDIAYHFDQRWLYQEISDYLRPELIDINYSSEHDLQRVVSEQLDTHWVKHTEKAHIIHQLDTLKTGATCRLMLHGFPYDGDCEDFETQSKWGALLETDANCVAFRSIFNAFCAQGASLSDPSDFLTREADRVGIPQDLSAGSLWRKLMELLLSSYLACEEIYSSNPCATAGRPSKRTGPTTWLRYITFHFRPVLPGTLSDFLSDCYNRNQVVSKYMDDPPAWVLAVKFPLPLGGYEGSLLNKDSAADFDSCVATLRDRLSRVDPAEQIGELASAISSAHFPRLPSRLLLRIEVFLNLGFHKAHVLQLPFR